MPFYDSTAAVPTELTTEEFRLRPIVAADAESDHAALMDTRAALRLWQQSTWPEDDFSVEDNRKDLVDMEERHLARRAFSYTVLDPAEPTCLGCVYVFPTTATFLSRSDVTEIAGARWADVDAVVYFWTRAAATRAGMDGRLLAALRAWFRHAWALDDVVFVVSEAFTEQLDLLHGTDLEVRFEIREPDKPQRFLAFG